MEDEKCEKHDNCKYNDHCKQIYDSLVKNSENDYIKDDKNKEQVMSQLKQQIDFLYARRYGKKRMG